MSDWFSIFQLKKYFNDTEDLMDIQMNNVWNQLIQFELL